MTRSIYVTFFVILIAAFSLTPPHSDALAAATNTSLTSAPNPSAYGETVTLKSRVFSADGLAPTGTVSFKSGTAEIDSVEVRTETGQRVLELTG